MFAIIQNGIPDSEMSGQWYTPREIWQVVAFVRTLGRIAPQKIDGDPTRGQSLYANRGDCARCHTVNGRGGALGPDLTDIGARRSVSFLRASLLDPEAEVPDGFMQIRLIRHDGRPITAIRIAEDAFSIQVRDLSGEFRSFFKSELTQVVKEPGKSPMPSYNGVFSSSELDDLTSFLFSLKGTR